MHISHHEVLAKAVEFKEQFGHESNITNFYFYLKGMGYNRIDDKELTIEYLSSFILVFSRNKIKREDVQKLTVFFQNLLPIISGDQENKKLINDLITNLHCLLVYKKTIEIV